MLDASNSTHHEMELVTTYPTGLEEWHCPTCGRRIVMSWPPAYKRVVLDPGDDQALHSGGKGGLQMGTLQIGDDPGPDFPDDLRDALEDAFKGYDFGD